ncbi:MAG TPA: twin-arginine translocase TatA/TatE family subunit [Deltaproteobacteria bacterium]|nr:twin-arginine translocase TatA/TatE family subunit [Deltaproteobacteria bacterium]
MFGLGTTELILILVIVLIIFGVGRLPEIGSGMGKAIKNFKKATEEAEIDITPDEAKEKDKLQADADAAKKVGGEKPEKHTVA